MFLIGLCCGFGRKWKYSNFDITLKDFAWFPIVAYSSELWPIDAITLENKQNGRKYWIGLIKKTRSKKIIRMEKDKEQKENVTTKRNKENQEKRN